MPDISGTSGDDPSLVGTVGDDVIHGLEGNDTITGEDGADTLYGDDGNDSLNGGLGSDTLYGGEGSDNLYDQYGVNSFYGGGGNDYLTSYSQGPGQFLDGGDGDDNITLGNGSGQVFGGLGNDQIVVSGGGSSTVDAGDGNDAIELQFGSNITVTGGAGSDIYRTWFSSNNVVTDFATGAGGDVFDVTYFLQKNNVANYPGGNPFATGHLRLAQSGSDTLLQMDQDGSANGQSFSTIMTLTNVNASNLTSYNFGGYAPGTVTVLNRPPVAPTDTDGTLGSTVPENLSVGSAIGITTHATDADGDALTYYFRDSNGNATQTLGSFTINASSGVVTLASALDFETTSNYGLRVYASDGQAESYSDFAVNVTDIIEVTNGNDGSLGTPLDFNTAVSPIYGSGGGDDFVILPDTGSAGGAVWNYSQTFEAGAGNDVAQGGNGNDNISGGDGLDRLFGGAGNDVLNGGAGTDILVGGMGVDRLTGGTGIDVFVFTASELGTTRAGPHDVITDFVSGTDYIDVSALYASHAAGSISAGKASDAAKLSNYKIGYYTEGGKTYIIGDTNGIAGADFTIELNGAIKLKPADFITSASAWPALSGGYDYASTHQDLFWA